MSKLRRLGTTFATCVIVLSQSAIDAAASNEVKIEEGITYCKVGDRELKLDLARPEGDGPFPAIVFIHGGGWRGGNRGAYRSAIREAAARGYVAATVTYRLTDPDDSGKPSNPFPAAVHDVKCAVRWLRANADTYHVDPERIGATGGSAGGHLSLMLGVTDKSAGLEGDDHHTDQSSRVQAVVNVFGPTDLEHLAATSPGAAPIVAVFMNGKPSEVPETYRTASPITYVTKDDPPMLTLHGTADKLVPPDQATRFDEKVKKIGGSHTLKLLDGQGHGFSGAAASTATEAMFEFFNQHLRPGKNEN